MPTTFSQTSTVTVDSNPFYDWDNAANWSGGIPVNGSAVVVNSPYNENPASYDDIAGLYLDSLTIEDGFVGVATSLTVANLNVALNGGAVDDGTFRGIYSYSLLSGAPSLVTIDSITGSGGTIQAAGAGAVTDVLATTDPGELYQSAFGGLVVITATPNANSQFYLDETGQSYDTGTIAFKDPGSTVSAQLAEVAVGSAIELPGSDVQSVTYGTSSIAVVTNLGTTTFSNVSYESGKPTGFTAAIDPATGLVAITFADSTTTTFSQTSTVSVDSNPFYNWNNASNWSGGIPVNGSAVVVNSPYNENPASYDDIAGLYLDSLTIEDGFVGVATSLTVANLNVALNGGAVDDGTFRGIYSYSLLSGAPSLVTIDSITGSGGTIQAAGAGAVTDVLATTDPGELYQSAFGGLVVITATPNANSQFYLDETGQSYDTGTIAFKDPGSTVSAQLAEVAVGSAIELPGSDVQSVTYGTSSITVVTNLGTTTFSNVSYESGKPTGFTAAIDPATGLVAITFADSTTTTFSQTSTVSVDSNPFYNWNNASNWSGGIPVNGSAVVVNSPYNENPASYDDIAGLYLDSLTIEDGFVGVATSLTVANLNVALNGGAVDDGTFRGIYSYSLLSGAPSLVTIDSITGSGGTIQAAGAGAVTDVLATTDPGELYQSAFGGLVVITATPNANSQFYLDETGQSYDTGTIAFKDPGSTVTAQLAEVAVGSAIELPGSDVQSVTYGTSSITVVTNLGTTTFSNVSYESGKPTGFTAAIDPATGLVAITFADSTTTTFSQTSTVSVDSNPFYNWNNASNWSGGIPVNGSAVVVNSPYNENPASYDDIAGLYLDSLTIEDGFVGVATSLTVANLNVALNGGAVDDGTFRGIYSYSLLSGAPSLVTIDSITGSGGTIQAAGAGAVTDVLATTDPGELYQSAFGGLVVITATPNANSQFYLDETGQSYDTGTIAFKDPGSTVSAQLAEVAVGSAIELPGSDVQSVTYGTSSITVVTNLGTTTFSNVGYESGKPTGFTAAIDPATGLEKITFGPVTTVAPTIAGALAGQIAAYQLDATPFSHVTIGDANSNTEETLTLSIGGAGGTLADGSGFDGTKTLTSNGGGSYTLDGTASAVTAELDALVFTPNVGTSTFSISDLSTGYDAPTVNTTTTVVASGVAVANDFNGDNKSDLLIQNSNGAVLVGELVGGQESFAQVTGLGPVWSFRGTGDFLGQGDDDFLIQNTSGALEVGQVSGGATTYAVVGGLGSGWTVEESGDFLGDGHSQFLIWNTNGAVEVGNVVSGVAQYTLVGGLGAEWSFVGAGDYLGNGQDQFLIRNTAGALVIGNVAGGQAQLTEVGALSAQWRFEGSGDFLGNGKDQVLVRGPSGAVDIGQVGAGDQMTLTQVGTLASSWTVEAVGDYAGTGTDAFVIQNIATGALETGTVVDGALQYAAVGGLGSQWSFPTAPGVMPPVDDLLGQGVSDILIQDTAGQVEVGQLAGGQVQYSLVGALGPEWSFRATGDFLGDGQSQFLIENTSGLLEVGNVVGGQTQYAVVGGLGPEWSFEGAGDFLGAGLSDILIENTSGVVEVGQLSGGQAQYAVVSGLGAAWSFKGVGDFLGDGLSDFMIENTSGAIEVGEVVNGQAQYTLVGGLGPEWSFKETGDFLGNGQSQFLIENTSGLLEVGGIVGGQAQYAVIGGLGSEWSFVGAGDYAANANAPGAASFLIENTSGVVEMGAIVSGQAQYAVVSGLGSNWTFHG